MPTCVTVREYQGEVKRVICSMTLDNALQPVASVLDDYIARCSYGLPRQQCRHLTSGSGKIVPSAVYISCVCSAAAPTAAALVAGRAAATASRSQSAISTANCQAADAALEGVAAVTAWAAEDSGSENPPEPDSESDGGLNDGRGKEDRCVAAVVPICRYVTTAVLQALAFRRIKVQQICWSCRIAGRGQW